MASKSNKKKKKGSTGTLIVLIVLLLILVALIGAVVYLLMRYRSGDTTPTKNAVVATSSYEEGVTAETDDSEDSFQFTYKGESNLSTTETEETDASEETVETTTVPTVVGDNLMSSYAYMFRLSDGAEVFEKNSNDQIYPASLTKMMTVLLAVENVDDLNQAVTVTQMDIDPGWEAGLTQAGFSAGEIVTVNDLLYGAMLPSGADACYAIADTIAGGSDAFVELMNQKAADLGMNSTHFSNCTGEQADVHYTTIADLTTLLKYALQNEAFKTVFTSLEYTTSSTTEHPDGIYLESRVAVACDYETQLDNGVTILGGKTGYTDNAGFCLASIAMDNEGIEYVLITAQAYSPLDDEGEVVYDNPNAVDAKYMYGQLGASVSEETSADTGSDTTEETTEEASDDIPENQ